MKYDKLRKKTEEIRKKGLKGLSPMARRIRRQLMPILKELARK